MVHIETLSCSLYKQGHKEHLVQQLTPALKVTQNVPSFACNTCETMYKIAFKLKTPGILPVTLAGWVQVLRDVVRDASEGVLINTDLGIDHVVYHIFVIPYRMSEYHQWRRYTGLRSTEGLSIA